MYSSYSQDDKCSKKVPKGVSKKKIDTIYLVILKPSTFKKLLWLLYFKNHSFLS